MEVYLVDCRTWTPAASATTGRRRRWPRTTRPWASTCWSRAKAPAARRGCARVLRRPGRGRHWTRGLWGKRKHRQNPGSSAHVEGHDRAACGVSGHRQRRLGRAGPRKLCLHPFRLTRGERRNGRAAGAAESPFATASRRLVTSRSPILRTGSPLWGRPYMAGPENWRIGTTTSIPQDRRAAILAVRNAKEYADFSMFSMHVHQNRYAFQAYSQDHYPAQYPGRARPKSWSITAWTCTSATGTIRCKASRSTRGDRSTTTSGNFSVHRMGLDDSGTAGPITDIESGEGRQPLAATGDQPARLRGATHLSGRRAPGHSPLSRRSRGAPGPDRRPWSWTDVPMTPKPARAREILAQIQHTRNRSARRSRSRSISWAAPLASSKSPGSPSSQSASSYGRASGNQPAEAEVRGGEEPAPAGPRAGRGGGQ